MKRWIAVFLCIVTVLLSVSVCEASKTLGDGMRDLNLAAQRYYETKIAYSSMMVGRPDEGMYVISYLSETGSVISWQLRLTEWGTWNLGEAWIEKDGVVKSVMGGDTDWEYVFRVVNPITQNLEFTGGNHGSERLVSLKMTDGVTGEAIALNVGESTVSARLVVEENTTVLLADKDYLPYAKVKRVYTFVGNRVNLDCDIEFARDVQMARSYTAMACISKDFARYCNFDGIMGVQTSAKGVKGNQYLGNCEAMECTLWGDDPTAKVRIGIYNRKDMTDNFSNKDKTFIWDMSENYNKVYFSKYDITVPVTVKTGTRWDFGTFWEIQG